MKKLLSIILCVVLAVLLSFLLCLTPLVVFAEAEVTSNSFDDLTAEELTPYFSLIIDTVDSYNRLQMSESSFSDRNAIELNTTPHPTRILSSQVDMKLSALSLSATMQEYLKSKLVYESAINYAIGVQKEYLDGTYEILEWETFEDILVCKLSSRLVFQYSTSEVQSISGNKYQVAIQNAANPIIIDWYNADPASFESLTRGNGLNLFDTENLITELDAVTLSNNVDQALTAITQSAQNVKSYRNEARSALSTAQNDIVENVAVETPTSETSSIIFDNWMDSRTRAVYYASAIISSPTYVLDPIPAYSTPATYYDFSEIANDCTNFISHCLRAGQITMLQGDHGEEDCWYYNSLSDRSSSWAGVNNLYNFIIYNSRQTSSAAGPITSYTNSALIRTQVTGNSPSTEAQKGDIIQIKYNVTGGYNYPNFGHSTIVSNIDSDTGEMMIAWRTSDYSYGFNEYLYEKYPPAPNTSSGSGNHIYRLIKIVYPFE